MSIWADIHKRSNGLADRTEDEVLKKTIAKLDSFRTEIAQYAESFLKMAQRAFNENDRYTCAIYYTLYAVALNKDRIDDEMIVDFLMERVFCPSSRVSTELSLDEAQKKAVVDSIFDRSPNGFRHAISSFDFSQVENNNLPFNELKNYYFSFYDFIGTCINENLIPDIRHI